MLNMRQRRGVELLSDYDCKLKYHPGKTNVVADALRKKEILRLSRKDENLEAEKLYDADQKFKICIKCAPFEALYGRKCRSPLCWLEAGDRQPVRLDIIQETIDKETPEVPNQRQSTIKGVALERRDSLWKAREVEPKIRRTL
ncbi:hypothetical protein Tco_0623400 [Tanacetum coccineum]